MMVPWITLWSGEEGRAEIRPCSTVRNKLAVWMPYAPGTGTPLFKRRHSGRSRRAVVKMLCNVCGKPTVPDDRWLLSPGTRCRDEHSSFYVFAETPVHEVCAKKSLAACPFLKASGEKAVKYSGTFGVFVAFLLPEVAQQLYGLTVTSERQVISDLHLTLPLHIADPLLRQMRPGVGHE